MIDVFNYLRIFNLVYSYTFFLFFLFFFFSFLIIFNVKRQGEINGFGATLMLLLFLFSRVALSYSWFNILSTWRMLSIIHINALTIGISDTLEAQKLGLNARRSESNGEFTRQNQNRVS